MPAIQPNSAKNPASAVMVSTPSALQTATTLQARKTTTPARKSAGKAGCQRASAQPNTTPSTAAAAV
jgi:hypothetical protein